MEDRYRLTGDILDGQMDLDILNVRRTDSGLYCCRVDVDGIFNDKKVIMNLRVIKGESWVVGPTPPWPRPWAPTVVCVHSSILRLDCIRGSVRARPETRTTGGALC